MRLYLSDCLGLRKIDRTCHITGGEPTSIYKSVYGRDPTQSELDNLVQNTRIGSGPSSKAWIDATPEEATSYLKGLNGTTSTATPSADTFATGQKSALDTQFAKDKADVTDFNTRYGAAVPNIISSVSDKYKIPDQVSLVNSLNSRIKDLQGNLSNNGAGGYASSNQVDAAINGKYIPNFNTAVTNLGTSTNAAQQEENQLTKPYDTEADILTKRMASEMTGFSDEQQNELAALVANKQAGTQLSVAEIQAANALAVAQKNYQAVVDSEKLKNQYQTVPGGSTLINTFNGQGTPVH